MATIRVPAPPPEAFRKNRPISDLVKSQIKHFQHLEHKLQLTLPRQFSAHELTTEAAASEYIAEVTAALCNRGSEAAPAAAPARLSAVPKPDSRPAKRSAPKTSKATRQSQGIAIAASVPKKRHAKKHSPAKHPRKKS